ncbi:MAG: hypothetical protein L0H94_00635 [Nitrospira sp.]|nr:hypothetical protein [Nitrospira sp.]
MISARRQACWIVGAVAAIAVLGVGALSPAGESDEKLLVAKEGLAPVASTSVQAMVIPLRATSGQPASPVAHRISAQARDLLREVGTRVKSTRQSAPSDAQETPLTFEELSELDRRLDQASLSYWNRQLNPAH